jgi:hypothetical protein
MAANVTPTYLFRDEGDPLHNAMFIGCAGACPERPTRDVADAKVVNGQLTSTYNPCVPNCAVSSPLTVTWVFNSSANRFEVVPRAVAGDPASHPIVYQVTEAVLLNGVIQVENRLDTVICGGAADGHFTPTGPVLHSELAPNAHVEVLPPNGAPTSSTIRPDQLPQHLVPGTSHTFSVMLSHGQVSSLIEMYHP